MPFPTTVIIDDFNRADEDPLSNGGKWSLGPGDSPMPTTLRVVSNKCAADAATGDGNAYRNDQNYGPDTDVYVTVSGPDLAVTVTLYLRLANVGVNTSDGYGVQFLMGSNQVIVYRLDNMVYTQLGVTVTGQAFASGDQLGIQMIGSTLKGYRKPTAGSWTEIVSRTDSTYTTAGKIGLQLAATSDRIDDFSGGTANVPSALTSRITSNPMMIVANGTAISTIAVEAKDAYGNFLTVGGATVTLATTDGALTGVTDLGNGTYTATLTSNLTVETVTITGTLNGSAITDTEDVAFVPIPSTPNPDNFLRPRPIRSGLRIIR
jgi:hypothetical protein